MTVDLVLAGLSVGFFVVAIATMFIGLWRAATRPLTDTDRYCARVDQDLDAEERARRDVARRRKQIGGWNK